MLARPDCARFTSLRVSISMSLCPPLAPPATPTPFAANFAGATFVRRGCRRCAELSKLLGLGAVRTACCVPLFSPSGKPHGVMLAVNQRNGRRFSRAETCTLHTLGVQGGSALFNTVKYEAAISANMKSAALLQAC